MIPEVEALHDPAHGYHVVGPVPDVRPYFNQADAFVIPLRLGSGTRLKALEALASGLPVVATPSGVEGLGLDERGLVVVAGDERDFAEGIIRVLLDKALRKRLSVDGRRHVEEFFDWEMIGAAFEQTLLAVSKGSAAAISEAR